MTTAEKGSSSALILVIDDDKVVVRIICSMLEKQGYRVESARTGVEGLAKAAECRPDLILMDINMPEMDGYEATERIKAIDYLHAVPVVFLSAQPPEKDHGGAFAAGGTTYIRKPITGQQLAQVVAMVLMTAKAT